MRSNDVVPFILSCLCGLLLLSVLALVAFKEDQRMKLEKHFSIEIPKGGGLTATEIAFLRPAVEKRLRELKQDWVNSCDAVIVVLDKKNELAITDADKSLQDLKKLENEKKHALVNLKEACGVAKYFKLVSGDCEPCSLFQKNYLIGYY